MRIIKTENMKYLLSLFSVIRCYVNAIWLHVRIVWRVWDVVEVAKDKEEVIRLDWETSWTVAKGIWIDE